MKTQNDNKDFDKGIQGEDGEEGEDPDQASEEGDPDLIFKVKLDSPERTTMLPINQPKANVIHNVIKKARNGVASPNPNGSPHFIIIAMDMPAKAIIGPIERSNSPAIIKSAAPTAMIPSCAIIAT